MIEIKNVKKDYVLGNTIVHALRGIDFVVSPPSGPRSATKQFSGHNTLHHNNTAPFLHPAPSR